MQRARRDPKAQLGLPELQLGVIPGFGGTQRLPRLVGLPKALDMMLKSKPIKAEEALELGLVDAIVPADQLIAEATQLAKDIADKKIPRRMASLDSAKLPADEAVVKKMFAGRQAPGQAREAPDAPPLALPRRRGDGRREGLRRGSRVGAGRVRKGGVVRGVQGTGPLLLRLALHRRRSRGHGRWAQAPGHEVRGGRGRRVDGQRHRHRVRAQRREGAPEGDQPEVSGRGHGERQANLASNVKKGRMTSQKADAIYSLCTPCLTYDKFKEADMVIEAVIENLDLKQKIFADLERSCRSDCILSTNTSTIDITKVASKMRNPERILGAHFFSPAHVMQLFEIIRTDATPPQVLVDALGLSKQIKKTPVVVGNCTGFAVNRVFFPYTMSACLLVDLGLDPYAIDNAIRAFGMPMGPFRLGDLVGHDVGVHVGQNFIDDFPLRVYESKLIPGLMKSGRMGEKSGKGFYVYDAKRAATPDPEGIAALLNASRAAASGRFKRSTSGELLAMTADDIAEMIFFPVVNEACRCLAEGVVVRASDLDVASILGMGFPPFRGGVVHWADQVGAGRIAARLREWCTAYGGIYQPCPYLEDCAVQGRSLAEGPLRGPDRSKL